MAEEQNQDQGQTRVEEIQKTLNNYTVEEIKKSEEKNNWSFPAGLNPLDNSGKTTEIIDIDKYWNFNNVVSPRVDVEFLKDIKDGVAKWININKSNVEVNSFDRTTKIPATNNNNYIVSMNITDNGVKELDLVLYDRNFTDLQKLIANSIQKINDKSEEAKKAESTANIEVEGMENGIQLLASPQKVTANIRVRYGYNEDLNSKVGKDYSGFGKINKENKEGKYYRWRSLTSANEINENELENATQEIPQDISSDTVLSHHYQQSTVLSEWEEFFIVGLTTNLTESGIKYNIKGISTSKMALDGYKMMQQYSKIVGKPKTILSTFMNSFNKNDNSPIKLVWADKSVSASDSTINGEELILDYESGKYMLINEDKKEELIENITIPINDISTYIKALLDLKACFKRNPNNTISDYINGYDVEYNKAIGYIENKNYKQMNSSKGSFIDVATLICNENEASSYREINNSSFFYNQFKLSNYIYSLKENFNDITSIVSNKDSTWFRDEVTKYMPYNLQRIWLASISSNAYENIENRSGIGKKLKNLNKRESMINDLNNVLENLDVHFTLPNGNEYHGSEYCHIEYYKIIDVKLNKYSAVNLEYFAPLGKIENEKGEIEKKEITDKKNKGKINIIGKNGVFTNFEELESSLSDTIINNILKNDKNFNPVEINNFFISNKNIAPLINMEKRFFNDNNSNLDNTMLGLKDASKSLIENLTTTDNQISTIVLLMDWIISLNEIIGNQKTTYMLKTDKFRKEFESYETIFYNINNFCNENFYVNYIKNYVNEDYISIGEELLIFANNKYSYNKVLDDIRFLKPSADEPPFLFLCYKDDVNDKKSVKIHLKSFDKEETINSYKEEILSYINNLLCLAVSFYNSNVITKEEKSFYTIDLFYETNKKATFNLLRRYMDDITNADFKQEYCKYIEVTIDTLIEARSEKMANNLSLVEALDSIRKFDEDKENNEILSKENFDELEEKGVLLSEIGKIITSIDEEIDGKKTNKKIVPVFKKMAIKELKNTKGITSREDIIKKNENSFEEFGKINIYGSNTDNIFTYMFQNIFDERNINIALNNIDKKVEELNTTLQNLNKKLIKVNNSNVGKEIELSLGTQESVNSENKLTKSLASLLNDFCSQCQPKISKLEKQARGLIDKDGNELEEGIAEENPTTMIDQSSGEDKKIDIYSNMPRYNLTWGIVGRYKVNTPVVGLYYKEPIKVSKLRKYNWGPGNAKMHCIKNLSISNGSEFAMMHNFNTATIGSDNNILISLTNKDVVMEADTSNNLLKSTCFFNQVLDSEKEKNLFNNLVNSVNQGNITLLGDPSLRFGGVIQPYTYPIYLNINLDRENSWQFNKQENKNEYYNEVSQLSGYYVITKITHNISTSGFTTTIEVMKYPGSNNIVK